MIGQMLALLGALVLALGAIGVVRFHDVLARMHALAKGSTLGILLLLAGAAANLRDVESLTSGVLAALLQVLTLPAASNMVSRAVYLAGGMPHEDGTVDEGAALLEDRASDDG
jgi:multicomponent Na+:H+ antiporter subunit G